MVEFDDGRLDNPQVLADADALLRPLAEAGGRLRREAGRAEGAVRTIDADDRPRAVIAVGPEARLLRAVLEPVCPVPFVAWPQERLPAWVGPLDLVVVLGGSTGPSCAHEALRRGARLLVTAPEDSALARQSAGRSTTLLPVSTQDPFAAAIVALAALGRFELGAAVDAHDVADALDVVALSCGHAHDVAQNPAKALALELADTQPLVWGGTVLAARASRRIAEALRAASGRMALAADASELAVLVANAPRLDPFADPFETPVETRPALVIVDDGLGEADVADQRDLLEENARVTEVRVSTIAQTHGTAVERYATLLAQGLFAAAYLRIGLGREHA